MNQNRLRIELFVGATILASSIIFTGCGSSDAPETGEVSGIVTMDGAPLANATITFQPEEGGRPSTGRTDEKGYYELAYTSSVKGAIMGRHKVSVSTYGESEEDEYGNLSAPSKESVPAKYNLNTELIYTVDKSSNEINIEVESDGEVVQPEEGADNSEDAT